MNIYKTTTMLAAIEQATPVTSFLRDRYFPTGAGDIFPTDEVLVEYKDATGNKLAPVVTPRKGSISVEREGYVTNKYAPPLIAPSRPLTIDELNKKGFGENLFSDRTPAERQAEILAQDLADFDALITNREEYIAAQCMFNNAIVLKQYADKYGSGEYKNFELRFYDGENDAEYVPGNNWNESGADILADLFLMTRMLTTKGNNASEVLVGSDVADVLMGNATIKELLDIRNYNLGEIAPVALPQGAARLGRLNIRGRLLDIITYDGTYVDEETGAIKSFVPETSICVTAPGAGRGLYGAVTQMEQESGEWVSHMGKRVPQYWADKNGRELTVSARPLFIPKTKNAFVTANVLN